MRQNWSSLVLLMLSANALADVNFTGFASINAGKVLSGDGVPHYGVEPSFLADYPLVSAYNEDISFKPESLFGLQVSSDLGDGLSATAQIVARGADDFNAQFEWAYISYDINESWTLQAGKKRLPLFYYSDFYDVGYAYVWMRPPADTYTWQIFNYNGINALYSGQAGDWSIAGNIYAGSEESDNNKLLSEFFFIEPTTEIWKNITGAVINLSNDWLEMRFTYMQYTNKRFRSGEPTLWGGKDEREGKFFGASFNADFGDYFILTELNRLDLEDDGELDSMMLTLGYRMNEFTPFIAYSALDQGGEYLDGGPIDDGEDHNTFSVGLRYDFHPSAAFKVQFDRVEDKSFEYAVAGDSESLTFGVDLVF